MPAGLHASQLGSTRLVSGHANVPARARNITADDILALGPRGGPTSPQSQRHRRILANRERIRAATAVAECAPQILDATIKAEEDAEDAPEEVLTEARSRLARVVIDKVRRRFIETALAEPTGRLRAIRLRSLATELASVKRTVDADRHSSADLKDEFKQLHTDTDALQAIERAQKLARDATACNKEIEAWHQQLERERAKRGEEEQQQIEDDITHDHEIDLMKKRGRIVDSAMKMLHEWKNHSEVAHALCDALLRMVENCGLEFRDEMDRRGLGVLASTVADLWLQRSEVARCALLLLSTVSIPLLIGMLDDQNDHPVLVCISLEVLNRRARESNEALDAIVVHGGRETLDVLQPMWAGNRMICLHALSLQRRLTRSKAKSQKKRREVTLAPEEAVRLRKAFDAHDVGGLGYITDGQLRKTMETLGMKMTEDELKTTMDEVDVDRSGTVSWPEFVFVMSKFGAGQSIEHKFTEQRLAELRAVFDLFDANHDGTMDVNELQQVLRSVGLSLGATEVQAMINSVDADASGCIEWPEFLYLMSKQIVDADNQHRCAFEFFDREGRGRIRRDAFVSSMQKLSDEFSKDELQEMIVQAKFEDDDPTSITYKEFVKMMMRT